MVSKATHIACHETTILIGFINYTACYKLGGINTKYYGKK